MNRSASKEPIRARLLEARRSMAFEDVWRLSSMVQERFVSSGFFRKAKRLSLYSSFQNEVLTEEIFRRALEAGKEVFFPRINGKGGKIEFFRVESMGDLKPGTYDVPEPVPGMDLRTPEEFDLIVVPGVAFDRKGGRLGFGKGYYDRALAGGKVPAIALAYEFQVIESEIPVQPHDVMVTAIVTEERIISAGGRAGA